MDTNSVHASKASDRAGEDSPPSHPNCFTTSAEFTWLIAKTQGGILATVPWLMPHSDEELHECFYICLPFPRGGTNGSKLGK